MSITDSSAHELLRQHFSTQSLARHPATIQRVLDMLRDWLAPEGKTPYPAMPFDQLMHAFEQGAMPDHGMSVDAFLDELARVVLPNTARLNHPMYIGHMTQALPWVSVVVEALAAVLNQNQVKIETAYASTLIEKQLLGWMHQRVYRQGEAFYGQAMRSRRQAIGNVVGGATLGNLTALAVALERQLPGTRQEGLHATLQRSGYRGLAVIGSVRLHYSLKKSMATLGLGEQALHTIPVDADNRMNLAALETTLEELRRKRIKLVALVGIAGTTETGAIDPLPELAAIARRERAWFHVDGAWGGALLLADRFRSLFEGIELADSVVIDGHKLMWVPMAQGMVLFKDIASLDALRHSANYILRSDSGDLGQTSLEGSRRFDVLKLWASFKIFGASGYATLLGQAARVTDSMRALLLDQEDFALTSDSSTFILTYRFVPRHLRSALAKRLDAGDLAGAAVLNRQLNVLNARLQERQKANGKSFVSRTVLESRGCPDGLTVLRVVLSNVTTTAVHLRAILAEQRELGNALVQELGLSADSGQAACAS